MVEQDKPAEEPHQTLEGEEQQQVQGEGAEGGDGLT